MKLFGILFGKKNKEETYSANLSESKARQLAYLAKIMEKYPNWTLYECYSAAIHYGKGDNVPFREADAEKCLKLFLEKR